MIEPTVAGCENDIINLPTRSPFELAMPHLMLGGYFPGNHPQSIFSCSAIFNIKQDNRLEALRTSGKH